ncbi:MAG: alpha/beta fold hydrolase [Frankiales bacterium]|nr:alpha/beta fold hydrolase [Frankiales bacterium]
MAAGEHDAEVHPASTARLPDAEGFAEREGVRLAWSLFGAAGSPTLLLLPTWSILPSRFWKLQVATLARHYRVVTFDGRGSGRSDRPVGAAAYGNGEYAADVLAVLDATGTDTCVLVSLSCAAAWAVQVAAEHPERTLGLFALSPSCGFPGITSGRDAVPWDVPLEDTQGWASYNRHNWLEGDYGAFLQFFFQQMFSEPHSTKQIEDCLAWGAQIAPATLVDATAGRLGCDGALCAPLEPLARLVRCPVMVLHGTDDRVRPHAVGERLAELTGGSLVLVEGGGHGPQARDPVLVNRLLVQFVDQLCPRVTRRTWTRAAARPRRVLYLSSPIGLGHAQRDAAIAAELRLLHPDLRVDWLAQHPVTAVLQERGERIHPASALLASESGHVEAESGEHDLHAFSALRRMDEILVANFSVFAEVVEDGHYDLVVGDEAWDVDYFLHENPELKRFSFAWMTDFVGWLPMPDGGPAEALLTADLNAEMLEQRARFGRVRDRSIFVGRPQDVVDESFGPGLPGIREWTAAHYDFSGYVTGFDPATLRDTQRLRRGLGVGPDDRLCLVTVGGSRVGSPLLHRVLDAVPLARRLVPGLRFLFVTGPRIDPDSIPPQPGVEVRGFVPDLYTHLAACDVAVVQGGLTTCMELTALHKPFVYVPLQHHFEQNLHVRHRLEQYGAGRCLDYTEAVRPEALADAIAKELSREALYAPVETTGAATAAALLAELL